MIPFEEGVMNTLFCTEMRVPIPVVFDRRSLHDWEVKSVPQPTGWFHVL